VDLRANLKRLRLPPTANITFNAQSTHKQMTVDAYLTLLSRQGYIEQQRVGEAGKKAAAGGKRGRPSATQANAAAGEEGTAFEWRWGNRAHSEVGEMGIAGFAAEFMVERMGIEEEEGEDGAAGERGGGGAARARREKARKNILEKMIKGFERSAGGNLSEIK
jgi:melanoma-associated antigen